MPNFGGRRRDLGARVIVRLQRGWRTVDAHPAFALGVDGPLRCQGFAEERGLSARLEQSAVLCLRFARPTHQYPIPGFRTVSVRRARPGFESERKVAYFGGERGIRTL